MHSRAVGILETNSIAKGMLAADSMIKAASVKVIVANPICPGKYLIVIRGDVAAVKSSIESGIKQGGEAVTETTVIPNIHENIFPAMRGTTNVSKVDAIGMIETFSAPSAVLAADEAVKSAKIQLLEIRLALALGGKAYALFTGEVGAVRAAIAAGVSRIKDQGLVYSTALIPAPHKDLIRNLL